MTALLHPFRGRLGFVLLALLGVSCDATEQGDAVSAESAQIKPTVIQSPLTGADTCSAAPIAAESLSSAVVVSDTTVGQADNVDLTDVLPLEAAPDCIGNATSAVYPRGRVVPGAGTGPDRAYRFQVDSVCTLSAVMTPTVADLGLFLFSGTCVNQSSSAACISDTGLEQDAEDITGIAAVPGVNYYLIVDGYDGSSGAFSLSITRTAGTCNLVTGCGDGNQDAWEACDDGNNIDCDGCSATCSIMGSACGDGVICGTEECDDDNTNNCDGCRGDCSAVETGCGDGFICPGEACDDENTANGDGCSASCDIEIDPPLVDSGTSSADASTPNPSGGAGGEGNEAGTGNGNGNEAGTGNGNGDGNETDSGSTTSSDSGTGGAGSGVGKPGSNGNRAGSAGSAAGDANQAAAPTADDGGGCAVAYQTATSKAVWWLLLGLVSFATRRRGNVTAA